LQHDWKVSSPPTPPLGALAATGAQINSEGSQLKFLYYLSTRAHSAKEENIIKINGRGKCCFADLQATRIELEAISLQ
jgi:hypothetical protein